MTEALLERDEMLARLLDAVESAAAGHGSVALVTGEAGIGKTSLIRAFAREAQRRARVLVSACDDLMTPRPLGPLRDAAAATDGPLAAVVAAGDGADAVFTAVIAELASDPPAVLIVEDVHWADDATLDVLAYVVRRIERLAAVVVLTFRDQVGSRHPLQRLLGALAGRPVQRLRLEPLSWAAVERLAAGTGADPDAVHRLTHGNPFFVTEVLAYPTDAVPASVMEAVLARVDRLGADCRAALEQLCVVPSRIDHELAATLLGPRLEHLTEAELAGVLVIGPRSLDFRHELTRRALERSLPALSRRRLNAAVVAALRAEAEPDLAGVMHHAVEAGDVETIVSVGPAAAREAARAGSHREALSHLECVRPYLDRAGVRERAAVLDELGWERYNAHRFRDAIQAGQAAVRLYEELDDAAAVGRCLVRVSRHLFMAGETDAAEEAAARAGSILRGTEDTAALATAHLGRGVVLALTDRPGEAVPQLDAARDLGRRAGRPDLAALALNYLGIAHVELGQPGGLDLLRRSIGAAIDGRYDEVAARGYCNLAELLFRARRGAELDDCLHAGLAFVRERGFWSHAYNLEVHRCAALLRSGDLDGAERGLRALVGGIDDPGMLYAYSISWLGRVLARRGDPAAGPMLEAAWQRAERQRLLLGLVYAGLAYVEWAWLAGRPATAERIAAALLPRVAHPGAAPFRAELLRHAARAGVPATDFAGCPEPWAAGLRGDWQAAAAGWATAEDPYERALELAEGDREAAAEGLRALDAMGAAGTAARIRGRLRSAGVAVPRRPRATTRANPAGLTDRQLTIVRLVGQGLTNGEIAARLVLSVRTVDHHVAAVLDKLGVRSRRDVAAAALAAGIELAARQPFV